MTQSEFRAWLFENFPEISNADAQKICCQVARVVSAAQSFARATALGGQEEKIRRARDACEVALDDIRKVSADGDG